MKVLLFRAFDNERVVQVDEEPIHLAAADDNSFLICLRSGVIHQCSAGEETTLISVLRPVTPTVLAILFVPRLDIVVTVEPENIQSVINVVRIYSIAPKAPGAAPPATAAATAPAPATRVLTFELPSHASVMCIASCATTGRLAVATESDVSVWEPSSDPRSSRFEKVVQFECTGVRHVAICDSHLAYATEHSVRVIECAVVSQASVDAQIQQQQQQQHRSDGGERSMVQQASPPMTPKHTSFPTVDDEYFVSVEVDAASGSVKAKPPISTVSFATSPAQTADSFVVYGPLTEVGQSIRVEQQYAMKSLQLLLHAQFPAHAGPIHTLFFLTEYSHISPSGQDQLTAVGMRCFVSTPTEGYLYNVRQPNLLATYTYSNETVQCCSNSAFLYAITASSQACLEAFTLRTSMDIAEYTSPTPCLMGMQPFLGPRHAVVVGDFIVLMSKLYDPSVPEPKPISPFNPPPQVLKVASPPGTSPAVSKRKSDVSWNLYMLHPTTLGTLYDELLARANKASSSQSEVTNASVYYQLLLEGHFLLQSKVVSLKRRLLTPTKGKPDPALELSLKLEVKTYSALLRHSAALLGDYYFQHGKEYHKSAQCFSVSDKKLVEVVRTFLQQEDGRGALLEYLDRVLFDPSMLEYMDEDPDVSNEILKYYVEFAPHRLSTVVIDSCLSAYSQKVALLLLDVAQEARCQAPASRPRRRDLSSTALLGREPSPALPSAMQEVPPKDLFAKALLHLDLGEMDAALAVLRAIGGGHVVEFCVVNPNILAINPEEPEQHVLASALRIAAPYALLEIACKLGADAVPQNVLQIPADPGSPDACENALLSMCSLEAKLSSAHERFRKARNFKRHSLTVPLLQDPAAGDAEKLCAFYLARILQSSRDHDYVQSPLPRQMLIERLTGAGRDGSFRKWLLLHQNAFSERPPWLDCVPPFGGPRDAPSQPQAAQPGPQNPFRDETDHALVTYDYTHFYTRKIQGLICSGLLGDASPLIEALDAIIAELSKAGAKDDTFLSVLFALALPLSSKYSRRDSLSSMVSMFPSVSLDFGIQFCTGVDDWSFILDTILASIRAHEHPGSHDVGSLPDRRLLLETYESVLEHISVTLAPDQFISLLPADGDIGFFIKYIERACQQHLAVSLKSSLLDSMAAVEKQVP